MRMERLIVPKEVKLEKRQVYEVWYLNQALNKWQIQSQWIKYEDAYNEVLRLESKFDWIFTEIRKVDKSEVIYRFYEYYESEV